jgi:hypothetical protein
LKAIGAIEKGAHKGRPCEMADNAPLISSARRVVAVGHVDGRRIVERTVVPTDDDEAGDGPKHGMQDRKTPACISLVKSHELLSEK